MNIKNRSDRTVFKTDTDISSNAQTAQRELQPWAPEGPTGPSASTNGNHARNGGGGGGAKDAETFGLEDSNTPWDQFETNSRLFGATTDYKEEIYTTKLDRSGSNFKQREKEATRLAAEIMGVSLLRRGTYWGAKKIANFG